MREILFRGKRVDNGEWAYGLPYKAKYGCISSIVNDDEERFLIFPETVGQYTGLTDKNGKKIFEGDIVRIIGDRDNDDWKLVNYISQIVYIDGGFCAIDGTIDNYGLRRYGLARCEFDLELVGNIHDNPELIEAEEC